MQLAICNETFRDWDFQEICRFSAGRGYRGLEIAPFTLDGPVHEFDATQRQHYREVAQSFGLEIIGLHWLLAGTQGYYLTDPDPLVADKTTQYFLQLVDLCADLGGRIMVLGSPQQRNLLPGIDHSQAMEIAATLIRKLVPRLEDRGVVLAVEPLGPEEGDFLNTAESGIDLIKMVDSPTVQLHLDVKAMSTESKPIPEIIRDSADYLHHFHANDPNRQGPGMGKVDYVPILNALRDIGYDNWISVEVFDYTPGAEALASDSIRYLHELMKDLD